MLGQTNRSSYLIILLHECLLAQIEGKKSSFAEGCGDNSLSQWSNGRDRQDEDQSTQETVSHVKVGEARSNLK